MKWLVPLILCKLLSGVLLNTSTWVSHKAAFCTLADIRSALADKMLRLPLGYFETTGSGRIKAIAVARGYLAPIGIDLICIPAFANITIDGEERTAIKLICEQR